MKTRRLSLATALAVGTIVLITLGATNESERNTSDKEIKELKSTITSLEREIKELEKRMQSVESRDKWVIQPKVHPWPGHSPTHQKPWGAVQPIIPKSNQPLVWSQGECNGWTYYLVPVQNHQDTTQ